MGGTTTLLYIIAYRNRLQNSPKEECEKKFIFNKGHKLYHYRLPLSQKTGCTNK